MIPELKTRLAFHDESTLLKELNKTILIHSDIFDILKSAIFDNPPVVTRDGGVIAKGYLMNCDN